MVSFRCLNIVLCTHYEKEVLNLALVQYYYSQGEHKLKVVPHGNSRAGEPYVRTMPSLMCKSKEKSTPKRVLQFVSNEAGGATSAGALPHNRQQVKMPDEKVQASKIMTHFIQLCICANKEKEKVVVLLSGWLMLLLIP